MQIYNFVSPPKQTFFAPEWSYWLCEDQITDVDFSKIAKLILEKEREIIKSTEAEYIAQNSELYQGLKTKKFDGYTGLGDKSLTSRSNLFNLLTWQDPEIEKLKRNIFRTYINFLDHFNAPRRKVWIQCWANVLRDGQEIKPHLHSVTPWTYLGGHICVQCNDTSTVYITPINQINDPEVFESKNAVGRITLFQNNIPHYTTMHVGNSERITIAFDITVDEKFNGTHMNKFIPFDDIL